MRPWSEVAGGCLLTRAVSVANQFRVEEIKSLGNLTESIGKQVKMLNYNQNMGLFFTLHISFCFLECKKKAGRKRRETGATKLNAKY